MTGRVSVRRGQAQDVDAVMRLTSASSQAPHWGREIYAEIVQAATGRATGLCRMLIVAESSDSGDIDGFAVASILTPEAELESVVVAENRRRKGIGKHLCRAATAWALDSGAAQMRLEVRASNVGARAMYEALGFVQTSVRRAYYSAPVEDAIEMTVQFAAADI